MTQFAISGMQDTDETVAWHEIAALPLTALLTVVDSLSKLKSLEQEWRGLEAGAQKPVKVFQSFDWVTAWSETYATEASGPALHILTGFDQGRLVFVWPLMRVRQLGVSTLTWLTDPFGQYGDVICRQGQNARGWLQSSVQLLQRLKDVDLVRLRHVRADSQVAASGLDFFQSARVPDKAPYLDLTAFKTDADYDARYSSTQRKRRKKIRKSLELMGPISFTRLPVGALADAAMAQAIDEKNAWLGERGRLNRVLKCPDHLSFLRKLARGKALAADGANLEVVVTEMKAGDTPVSWEIGFRHHNIHYGYITSHVNKLTDWSPGRLHMDQSQRACLADGMTQFDLMVPNDIHKESWASNAIDTEDYYLPLTPRGALVGHVYVRTIRPLLRKVYYQMENSPWRASLKKMFQRQKPRATEET